MIDKTLVIKYLAQGIPTSQIAMAAGCDESYISQLKADPEIQAQMAQHAAEVTIKDMNFDETLESAEELALSRIQKSLGFANMGQALSAFRILNTARRRKDGPAVSGAVTVNVNLTLPASALPRYVTNANNEIVEVEGKTLVSATPRGLDSLLAQRAGAAPTAAVTALDKAAVRLGALAPLPKRAPRTLPLTAANLNTDML
jgi:hypothetical protein